MTNTIPSLKHQLTQLKNLHESGALQTAHYEASKAAVERQLLDLVMQDEGINHAATLAPEANPSAPQFTPLGNPPNTPTITAKPSYRLLGAICIGIAAIAGAGYLWNGAPSQLGLGSANSTEAAAGSPHATNFDQIAAMTDKLANRLKEQPNDAEGWAMLARSYSVLGRHPEALDAYQKAVALRKDDATLLADYADSLAVKNNKDLNGEPMKVIERALKIDPKNLKALSLAGTNSFARKNYPEAVKYWEKVVQFGPVDNDLVKQVEPSLAEARELAGLPALKKSPIALPGNALAATGVVSGTVLLSASLQKLTKPDDTVFIFARSTEGSRMPLAIIQKQVKDLPFKFTLDDSTAMSAAAKISGATKVLVGARVSKSGNAMPQPGDFSGLTDAISVGASGIQLEIKDVVKP
jgi:cytochrome c-type biogenesis protein CcmH